MSSIVTFEELNCQNGKRIAVATLNAERSLNALSLEMIELLYPQLEAWKNDDAIAMVFLQGSGNKAFCAGGDIVAMYKAMETTENQQSDALANYFTHEYKLDYLIHTYGKPFLVWGNGIVMGGGLGMMVGASHRVVTETSRIAMPEISIGLYPDVGATWFLNRMPDQCGLFLGLTGASINAADAKYTGLADFFIEAEQKSALLTSLQHINWGNTVSLNHEKLSTALLDLERLSASKLPVSHVKEQKQLIDQVMSHSTIEEIVNAIVTAEVEDPWFNKAQKSLQHGSALSGQIVYRQLKHGQLLTLADCFRLELNLSVKSGEFGEFKEGVRALLIDKDNKPNWRYKSIDSVDNDVLNWFFEPLWTEQEHPLAQLGS